MLVGSKPAAVGDEVVGDAVADVGDEVGIELGQITWIFAGQVM